MSLDTVRAYLADHPIPREQTPVLDEIAHLASHSAHFALLEYGRDTSTGTYWLMVYPLQNDLLALIELLVTLSALDYSIWSMHNLGGPLAGLIEVELIHRRTTVPKPFLTYVRDHQSSDAQQTDREGATGTSAPSENIGV